MWQRLSAWSCSLCAREPRVTPAWRFTLGWDVLRLQRMEEGCIYHVSKGFHEWLLGAVRVVGWLEQCCGRPAGMLGVVAELVGLVVFSL
jgi:hypothetical protein